MTRLAWSDPAERRYETGLDRGVLYPKDADGVVWNGLTAVDENGSGGTVSYYMDGRPFLHFPQRKEYSATLKAYTFPDEFMALTGMPEAAPGMYLDSQVMESFDLSYRTLVGNAIVGLEHGYKLHLIYNATATPQTVGYATLSDAITPIDFAWDLNAVPVPVTGYHPTAHIMIDSRDVDPDILSDLEDMLYGTDTTAPEMPHPQVIFDLLTFGDSIIITDLGNGFWTAEGSSENVYMVNDTTFRIDNVNAVDTTPGVEYDISTTP